MGPRPPLTPLLLLLAGTLCSQAPAAAHSQYEVGTVYQYQYTTEVLLNEPQALPESSPKDVGFRLKMGAELTAVWQHHSNPGEKIIQVQLVAPKLSVKARQGPAPDGFVEKYSKVDSLPLTPVFAHWVRGKVARVFVAAGEEAASLNLKKGLVSLLQMQTGAWSGQETDASGLCDVSYVTKASLVTKTKTGCRLPQGHVFFNHTNQVLGASTTSTSSTTYTLRPEDSALQSAEALETHITRVEARPSSASEVISRQSLVFTGERAASSGPLRASTEAEVVHALSSLTGASLQAQELTTAEDVRECIACKTLNELVHSFRQTLESSNMGSQSAALAYIRLVKKMRESSEEDIGAVLRNKLFGKILPQLLDIAAGAQTPASHRAAVGFLRLPERTAGGLTKGERLAERWLTAAGLQTHPDGAAVSELLELAGKGLASPQLQETLLYAVSSMARTLARRSPAHPAVAAVTSHLHAALPRCSSQDCSLQTLAALQTLQSNASVPLLLQTALTAPRKPAVAAMRALQTLPRHYLTDQALYSLERLLLSLDRPADSSLRLMAADVLLTTRPSAPLLRALLQGLRGAPQEAEFGAVVMARLRDLLGQGDPRLLKAYREALSSPSLRSYDVLAQSGLSTAFSRPLTAPSAPSSTSSAPSANASFTNMLEVSGGLLKRSTVDVTVSSGEHALPLLSFGMYAGGLDMFGGGQAGEKAEDEAEEANAGLQIALMDMQLRPLVFFTSTSEAMGHVWSGTASERTTALQGTALLQDHQQRLPLQNGFAASLLLTGAVSYDLAGQIQISVMWSKEAHSLVEIGAGVVIQGQARVDAAFVQAMLEHNTGVTANMDISADVTMSGDVSMCMKMSAQPHTVTHSVRKLERLPGSAYALRKYRRRRWQGPGRTYAINRKTNQLCNAMGQ